MDESKILGTKLSDLSDEGKQTKVLLEIRDFLEDNVGYDDTQDDSENNENKESETTDNKDSKSKDGAKDKPDENAAKVEKTGSEKVEEDIVKAGGLKNYLSDKFANTALGKSLMSKRKKNESADGDAVPTGTTTADMKKGLGILGKFFSGAHAKGTENAKEGVTVEGDGLANDIYFATKS
jgi:hypothetical protein